MALFNVSKGLMDAVKGVVGNSIQDYVEEQKKVDRMVAEKVLSPKQKKIAAVAGDPNKIDAEDFAKLRAGKKVAAEGMLDNIRSGSSSSTLNSVRSGKQPDHTQSTSKKNAVS